jgi:hypothetical protein
MEEELEGIVQNMIDAGESEENIALVIRDYEKPKDDNGNLDQSNNLVKNEIQQPQMGPEAPESKGVKTEGSGESVSPSVDMNSSSESKPTNPFSSEEDGGIKLKEEAGQRLLDSLRKAGEREFEITDDQITQEALKIQREKRLRKAEDAVNGINKAKTEKEQRSYLGNLFENLKAGSAELGVAISSIPETIYDLAAVPQNGVAEIFDIEELKASSSKIKKDFDITNPALDYYLEESEEIQKDIAKFNEKYESTSIYENIKKGNYQDAFELLGSGITQSAPLSIGMMAGGATTSLGKAALGSTVALTGPERIRMEDNPDLSELEKTLKSFSLAGAESVFGVATSGSMGKVYKDIVLKEGKEKGAEVFRNGMLSMYQTALKKYGGLTGAVGEGVEEVATTVTQNMINGRPAGEGVQDAFILGVGSGGVYGAPINIKNVSDKFKKGYKRRQVQKIVDSEDNNLKKVSDAFEPSVGMDVDDVAIDIVKKEGSLEMLEDQLSREVKEGIIDEEYKEAHLEKFYNTSKGLAKTKGVNFDSRQKATAVNLISRKERLESEVKGMDSVLSESKKQEIEAINEELRNLIGSTQETNQEAPAEEAPEAAAISPENSSNYANLTEEGDDFVFFHKGKKGYEEIKPSTGGTSATSREESSALSKVGGVAMFYTDPTDSERQVSSESTYAVRVPKDKVYDFNSDPLDLIDEARERHNKENPDKAFDANSQVAYVAQIAGEKGFDMVVSEWRDGKTRAQTTKALKPSDVREETNQKETKSFDKEYTGNREKGFEPVVPKTKKEALQEAYNNIHNELNKNQDYSKAYGLYTEKGKYSQEEITKIVEESNASQEAKDQYMKALNFEEGKRNSRLKEDNKAEQTQGFFSDVVSGKSAKYKPSKKYEYEKDFDDKQESFRENYDKKKGEFDEHIATSIPTFRDTQVQKGAAIVETFGKDSDKAVMYDIGGSEGGFAKTITEESGSNIRTINIDPNSSMKEAFDRTPVEGAEFAQQPFNEGFDGMEAYTPQEKADVVHESMVFQFLKKDREGFVEDIADNYLKDDGVFITEQKFKADDPDVYAENEKIKNTEHKSKYYTDEQQKLKGEDVLVGMDKNQANFNDYISLLKDKFDHVETYWSAGNFKGVIASNNKAKVDEFLNNIGDTSNDFTATETTTPKQDATPKKPTRTKSEIGERLGEIDTEMDALYDKGPRKRDVFKKLENQPFMKEIDALTKERDELQSERTNMQNDEFVSLFTEEQEIVDKIASMENSSVKEISGDLLLINKFKGKLSEIRGEVKPKQDAKTKDQGGTKTGADTSKSGDAGIKQTSKEKADSIRERFKTGSTLRESLSNLSSGVPKGAFDAAWDLSVEAVAQTIEAGGSVAQAIQNGLKKMRSTKWYKDLSKEGKKETDKVFQEDLKKEVGFDYKTATTKEIFEEARREADQARRQASRADESVKEKLGKAFDKFMEEGVDRQFSVKKAFNKIGMGKVVDYMVTKAGASSLSKFRVEKAYKGTFKGLNNKDTEILEELIDNRRVIAIDENRVKRGLEPVKHKNGNNKDKAEARLEAYKDKLGEEKYNNLFERSENFFSEYKGLLQEMKEEGLISGDLYDKFAEVNYVPREFLDFMENMDGDFLVSELEKVENIPLSAKQIKTMKGGYEGNNLMDAWYLLQKSILTRTKAVFSNKLNKTFRDEFLRTQKEVEALREKENPTKKERKKIRDFEKVENKVKVDEVVEVTEAGTTKYKLGDNMKGFSSLFFYEDGVKNRLLVENALFERLTDTNNQYINSKAKQNTALVSGTSVVKTFATGNNPFFFITNTPRDFLFALTFSDAYGNEVISNAFKLAGDMAKGVKEVVTGGENYQKYLEYGGGMDFLALQGKYKGKGWTKSVVDGVLSQKNQDKLFKNKFKRGMDKFNLASEVGIRLGVFNRTLKKELNGKDINDLPKEERDHLYTKAVRNARELTDFNQGGRATKAADAAIPYLNAATQGTRAATSSFNNPKRAAETSLRILQVTAYSTAATLGAAMSLINLYRDNEDEEIKSMNNGEIYLKTIQGVSQYDLENYYVIPKGSKDKNGDWGYFRVAKAQSLSPMINLTEHYMRSSIAKLSGGTYKGDPINILKNTIEKNIIPIELTPTGVGSRIPMVNATFAMQGIDLYTGNPLSWDKGEIPEQLEGMTDDRVESFYKEFGKFLGESPVRMKGAVESYITTPNTNPYISLAYSTGNLITSDKAASETYSKFGNDLIKTLSSRVSKTTSDYNSIAKLKEVASDEAVKAYEKHMMLEYGVRNIVKDFKTEKTNKSEAYEELNKLVKNSPEEANLVRKWVESEMNKKQINPLVSSLRYTRNKEVRAIILAEKYGDSFLEPKKLEDKEKKIFIQLKKNNVLDVETIKYYKNLFKLKP